MTAWDALFVNSSGSDISRDEKKQLESIPEYRDFFKNFVGTAVLDHIFGQYELPGDYVLDYEYLNNDDVNPDFYYGLETFLDWVRRFASPEFANEVISQFVRNYIPRQRDLTWSE